MAEICCGVVSESEGGSCETSTRAARRRRADPAVKRRCLDLCDKPLHNCGGETEKLSLRSEKGKQLPPPIVLTPILNPLPSSSSGAGISSNRKDALPKFGFASVCGRRRDMEDAVASHPSFFRREKRDLEDAAAALHYFGVYDGHGCSHVATKCKERLHEMVKEELLLDDVGEEVSDRNSSSWWRRVMERSFTRMDREVVAWNENVVENMIPSCRCELQSPDCDAVGSTAVVAVVTPCNIVVANCGDSRAVLCRNGKAIPLSTDHKPDRPDEMNRIQAAGGRVIFWEGARVLGVLAMSRAIAIRELRARGDNNGAERRGRVLDTSERWAVGRGVERDRMRCGEDVPQGEGQGDGRRHGQSVRGCIDAAHKVGSGAEECRQRKCTRY
ncbi:protein phosphatase 2C 3-like isoform X2 [Salvia hispanica]|uniref:protein phosphatase 2C 3-like isoform X2 n=1 Tax=Salvia hispanica TaxID=49212 RepID=UPI002008F88B|nr:protein phosphatase 2C 3-like isoform X2 [Salvia hispanica]